MTSETGAAVRHIVIVGGGTAGWMSAALLARVIRTEECRITVVAPVESRGIGVGEATIPTVVRLLRDLGIDEAQMMHRCNATWKLGIQFSDWVTPERDNWHPFGVCGAWIDGRDLFHAWFVERVRSQLRRPYHSWSLHWAAALAGKCPHSATVLSPISASGSYAFHLDATAFATMLREQALTAGVGEQDGVVVEAVRNSAGDITSVRLDSGAEIAADFFIDCSGFEAVLANKTLGNSTIDWKEQLLCNRAVTARVAAGRVIPPYTQSQALSAGWMWRIPLAEHTGYGYVYSSDFKSDDDAWNELRTAARIADDGDSEPRFISMEPGRRTDAWQNNVLAVGLSAGFVEPLESSGLHLTQIGIERFLEVFSLTASHAANRRAYNMHMAQVFDEVRDFVQLHYHLSQRDQDAFWIAAREAPTSEDLQHRLALYTESGMLDDLHPDAFPATSYYHLLTGNGRYPRRPAAMALATDSERVSFALNAIRQQNENALRDLPLHEEMLSRIRQPPLAKAS